MGNPLVSCIMPSKNKGSLVDRAIKSFQAQTYRARELVVLRSGPSDDEHPVAWRGEEIVYERVPVGLSIGELRNIAVRIARGSIIAHWDDDDWSHPDRLALQVDYLRRGAIFKGGIFSGATSAYWLDEEADRAWTFDAMQLATPILIGGTLAYRREEAGFDPYVDVGEDTRWMWLKLTRNWRTAEGSRSAVAAANVLPLGHYVASVHRGNTSPKDTSSVGWSPADPEIVRKCMEVAE